MHSAFLCWVDSSQFFCGLLVVTRGRYLSMISSVAHPRWPLQPPSWIWFPSIRRQTSWSIHPIFCGLLGVSRGRFLSMINSATHPRWPLRPPSWIWFPLIFWLTPASTDLHHIPLLPKPYFPYTHRQLPTQGHMPRLA
jgi:hypothetical protein